MEGPNLVFAKSARSSPQRVHGFMRRCPPNYRSTLVRRRNRDTHQLMAAARTLMRELEAAAWAELEAQGLGPT